MDGHEGQVRAFVEFEDAASAERARNIIDGRFFSKRQVSCGFFEESRFPTG